MPEAIQCPCCGEMIPYNKTNCSNGTLIGYPNVRRAEDMRPDLVANHAAAVAAAAARGSSAEVSALAAIADGAGVTINVTPKIFRNLSYSQPYISYYKALAEGDRPIAMQQHHATRLAVDAKVHTGYETHILNAALSGDGRGLVNYGAITLRFKCDDIEDVASLLRENAFDFYEHCALGGLHAVEPPGWRSTWPDRALLVIATLAEKLVVGMDAEALQDLVLHSGTTRHDDRYVEVHIYGSLTWRSIAEARLDGVLTETRDRLAWATARDRLDNRSVAVSEAMRP